MHGTNLEQEPLEFTMNNQHMNGGILIDDWGRTSLRGCYAVGEAAGSHGVTRPGGAALNSGQVFGKRVAVAIKRSRKPHRKQSINTTSLSNVLAEHLEKAERFAGNTDGISAKEVQTEIQARMSNLSLIHI